MIKFRLAVLVFAVTLVAVPHRANAEPTFLSRQYPRCTTCHYSPTGGGLLTPYGRSLSREEISMLGRQSAAEVEAADPATAEEAFLGGVLGDRLGPLQLGLDMRPSHLALSVGGRDLPDRNFFMNADLLAAYQQGGWTFYGEIGRQPRNGDWAIDSYEHWVGYQSEGGLGVRAGRFLPAYGVRFADHTSFNRSVLELTQYDQVYGVEVSLTGERSLAQAVVGPGRADSLVDDDGRRAFSASGRFQFDLTPRIVVVGSALYRDASDLDPKSGAGGFSFGFAPGRRVTTWTQLDTLFQDRLASDRTHVLVHQTSIEAVRGLWIRISPQIRWTDDDPQAEVRRFVVGADVFPRTHWHVNLSYYRDRIQFFDLGAQTFLAQLHLYL